MPGDDDLHLIAKVAPMGIVLEYLDDKTAEEVVKTHLKEVLSTDALHVNTRWAHELKSKYRITNPERWRAAFKASYGVEANDIELLSAFDAVKTLVDVRVASRAEEEADPLFSFNETALILIIYKQDVEAFIRFLKNKALESISTIIEDSIFKDQDFFNLYSNLVKKWRKVLKQKLTAEEYSQLVPHYESPISVMQRATARMEKRLLQFLLLLWVVVVAVSMFIQLPMESGLFLTLVLAPIIAIIGCALIFSYPLMRYWATEREIQAEMKEVLKSSQDPFDNAKIKQTYQKKIYENTLEMLRLDNLHVTDGDRVYYKNRMYYAKVMIAFTSVFILTWLFMFLGFHLGFQQSLLYKVLHDGVFFLSLFAGTLFFAVLGISSLSGIIKYKFLHAEELWLAANAEVERLENQQPPEVVPRRYSLTNINLSLESASTGNTSQALFYVSPGQEEGDDDSARDEKRPLLSSR